MGMLSLYDDASFVLTESAAKQVAALLDAEAKTRPVRALRVGVKGGGCSGLSYFMEFTDAPEAKDRVFAHHGVEVYIDPKSLPYLKGTELDFSHALQSAGFKWNNPNMKKSCGCGESFSV
jgi:iron-sulfur cluster assembly protein